MQVHWKALGFLGLTFWGSMCAIDHFYGNIIQQGEFKTILDFEEGFNDDKFLQEFPWETVIVWTAFAFTSSIGLCFFLKIIRIALGKFLRKDTINPIQTTNNMQTSTNFELLQTSSRSKIPIPVSEKSKSKADLSQIDFTNTFIPAASNILEAVKDFPVTIESSEENVETKRFTEQNNWKEYSALTRKLEQISREKKELAQQLSQSQRENRQTKQQLEDILNDRSAVIRRLEIATREIKLNTNTKQMTLEKLEEAVSYSNQMKNKIMQLSEEKEVLEKKLKLLEEEYKFLQVQNCILQKQDESVQKLKEIKDSISELEANSERDIEVNQSEKDIEKIQMKLLDLEMSLDKMRMTSSTSFNTKEEDSADRGRESKDTLDNERLIIEIYEDDEQEEQENAEDQDEEQAEDSDEKVDESSECEGIAMVEFKESSTDTSSSATEEESPSVILNALNEKQMFGDPCKGGMVSQSPAFQKFLLSVLDQNQQNKSILTS